MDCVDNNHRSYLGSLRDLYIQPMLYYKKSRMVTELFLWPEQLKVVIPEKERQGFVHLKQSQVLSDTWEKSVSAN
jgi:hypothetical protein